MDERKFVPAAMHARMQKACGLWKGHGLTMEYKIGYKDILKQKEYMIIVVANAISRFGDSIDAIAFTWLVYAATGSASWSAVIFALNQLPSILFQPFAGVLVEKMNKKRLMVGGDILRGIVVAALAFCYVTGAVYPWILAVFTFTVSTVEAFCLPAGTAIIPKILEEQYYEFGVSLNSVLSSGMQLIGLGAAGLIIGSFGIGMAVLIDAATFFGAALMKAGLRVREESVSGKISGREYFTDLAEGFFYVKGKRVIRNFIIIAVLVNAVLVPFNALETPLAVEVLGQGTGLMSVMGIALMVGIGIGSLLFPYISRRMKIRPFVVLSGCFMGLGYGVVTLGSFVRECAPAVCAIAASGVFVMGIAVSMLNGEVQVEFMKTVKEEYLARAGAIMSAGCCMASPVVSFLLSGAVVFVPVREIFWICSILCVIIFLSIAMIKVRLEDASDGDSDTRETAAYAGGGNAAC